MIIVSPYFLRPWTEGSVLVDASREQEVLNHAIELIGVRLVQVVAGKWEPMDTTSFDVGFEELGVMFRDHWILVSMQDENGTQDVRKILAENVIHSRPCLAQAEP